MDNSPCCSLSHAPYGDGPPCLLLEFMLYNVLLFVFDYMCGDVFCCSFLILFFTDMLCFDIWLPVRGLAIDCMMHVRF